MKRRNIHRVSTEPKTTNDPTKHFPRISIKPNSTVNVHPVNYSRNFKRSAAIPSEPITFVEGNVTQAQKDICFVVGGGPSLQGFDFSKLNGYDTIAVNKAVEYLNHPTYFITTDYTYLSKATLPIEKINQKTKHTYFVANMVPNFMEFKGGYVTDTRDNRIYANLFKYQGVIRSGRKDGFGLDLGHFSNGANSGHCGIQLAILAGYKKIYLLGFDLNDEGQTHFHQSYTQKDQQSFKTKAKGYANTLLSALATFKGSQEIINLSANSILTTSPHIKTQSFTEVMIEQGDVEPAINPIKIGLKDLMVVGYYTVNTPYEQEAQKLLQSLNRLKLNHDIVGVQSLGNWQANTRFKAGFMLDMLIKWPKHRLLYVDVDAVMHQSPNLFRDYKCDIAVRWQDFRWRKNECLSGTIYMENNKRTKRICELWRDINISEGNDSKRMEQWNLDSVIEQMKSDPDFTYKNLPPEYTMIFDSMRGMYPNIVPVIEHFQASRRFRDRVNE